MITRSLHVGLNQVDSASYNGWPGLLSGCHNDSAALAILASRMGSTAWGLNTVDTKKNLPTVDAFAESLTALTETVRPGELALISYSGHGAADTGWGEAICLYDGLLYDRQLRTLLSQFKEGVRWIFVLDSCHSGGMDKGFMTPLTKSAPRSATTVTRMPTKWWDTKEVVSSGVMLCACQPDEVAYDGDQFGAWTGALLRAWPDGLVGQSVNTWFNRGYERCPEHQHPVMRLVGHNHDWLDKTI